MIQFDANNIERLPNLLSISEAAKVLNVSPWTLRNWDKRDVLKPVRVGTRRDRRYKKEDIIKILQSGTDKAK